MSEFTCACGGLMRSTQYGRQCDDCGGTKIHAMDGMTAAQMKKEEEHYDAQDVLDEMELDDDTADDEE